MGALSSADDAKGTTTFAQLVNRYANWMNSWPGTWPWSIGAIIFAWMLWWTPVWFGTAFIAWLVLSGIVVFAHQRHERRAKADADPAPGGK